MITAWYSDSCIYTVMSEEYKTCSVFMSVFLYM